jgi:hypothetical protein
MKKISNISESIANITNDLIKDMSSDHGSKGNKISVFPFLDPQERMGLALELALGRRCDLKKDSPEAARHQEENIKHFRYFRIVNEFEVYKKGMFFISSEEDRKDTLRVIYNLVFEKGSDEKQIKMEKGFPNDCSEEFKSIPALTKKVLPISPNLIHKIINSPGMIRKIISKASLSFKEEMPVDHLDAVIKKTVTALWDLNVDPLNIRTFFNCIAQACKIDLGKLIDILASNNYGLNDYELNDKSKHLLPYHIQNLISYQIHPGDFKKLDLSPNLHIDYSMLSQGFFLHGPRSEWLLTPKETFEQRLTRFCGLESEASYQGFGKKYKEFQSASNDNFKLPYAYMRFGLDDKGPTAISILLKKASDKELTLVVKNNNIPGFVAFALNGESYKGSLSKHPLIAPQADSLMGKFNREIHNFEAVSRQLKRDFTFQKSVEELRSKLQGGEILQSPVQLENGIYKEFKDFHNSWSAVRAFIPQDLRKSLKLQADKDAGQPKEGLTLNKLGQLSSFETLERTLKSILEHIKSKNPSLGIKKILEEYGEANHENFLQYIKFRPQDLPKLAGSLDSLGIKKDGDYLAVNSYHLPELCQSISLASLQEDVTGEVVQHHQE